MTATATATRAPRKRPAKFDVDNLKNEKTNPGKVKNGDVMAVLYYIKVEDTKDSGTNLGVMNLDTPHGRFKVEGFELVKNAFSADQFETERKVNQTDMIKILSISYNRPFTVCWDKEDKTERVLRGRLIKPDPWRGYSMVEDLDKSEGDRIRQVDHRGLKWLIVGGVKYSLNRKKRSK